MGLSAVCNCGISCSYSLFLYHIISSRSDSLTRSERDFVLGSHLLLVYLNSPVMFNNYLQLTTSADNIFRWILSWRFKG